DAVEQAVLLVQDLHTVCVNLVGKNLGSGNGNQNAFFSLLDLHADLIQGNAGLDDPVPAEQEGFFRKGNVPALELLGIGKLGGVGKQVLHGGQFADVLNFAVKGAQVQSGGDFGFLLKQGFQLGQLPVRIPGSLGPAQKPGGTGKNGHQ